MTLFRNRYGSRAAPSSLAAGGLLMVALGCFARLLSIRDDEAWLLEKVVLGAYAFAGLLFAAALVTVAFTRGRRWPHAIVVVTLITLAATGAGWAEAEYARGMTYVP